MGIDVESLLGELKGMFESSEKKVANLDKALYGNGQPGALERLTRTEQNVEALSKEFKVFREEQAIAQKEFGEALDKLACTVETTNASIQDLKKLMEKHVDNKDLHSIKGLFLHREVIAWTIIAFLVLSFLESKIDLVQAFLKLIGL